MGKFIDLTNQKFGRLTVLERLPYKKNNQILWKCQCECGNIIETTGGALRSGNTKSCGCIRRKNLIGKKFGKLTVIDYTNESRHGRALWKCQCDCGNISYATTEGLRTGDNVSCGCRNLARDKFRQTYMVDFTNQRFGLLTVIGTTDMRTIQGNQIWKCLCDCGNICYVSTNHLQTGNTKSCGCLQGKSNGELKIKKLLDSKNITYKAEYVFPDLPNRRFDFAILNAENIPIQLIEFDGEQHYFETPFFKISLQQQQKIDLEKTNFALSKNIPLIRIPYWKRENLKFEDLQII